MQRVKTVFKVILALIALGFLHYVLPQHDVVRVTSTEIIRTDFNWMNRPFFAQADSGSSELQTRDLRLINTQKRKTWLFGFVKRPGTRVMVYRNEDTGWIWPPYFKFDSADLQAEAAALIDPGRERWAVMTHYGWRNKYLSTYPNAVALREVEGPDVTVIPWFNIFFFVALAVIVAFLRAAWRQFRERAVDPAIDDVSARLDTVGTRLSERRRKWFGGGRG